MCKPLFSHMAWCFWWFDELCVWWFGLTRCSFLRSLFMWLSFLSSVHGCGRVLRVCSEVKRALLQVLPVEVFASVLHPQLVPQFAGVLS